MSAALISFEGVEGAGKSTQIALLHDYLRSRGEDVIVLREPGGVPIAEAIRGILLEPSHRSMAPETELLLYAAARAQLVAEVIRPALAAGKMVLSDRFADSTTVYQGYARGLDRSVIGELHRLTTQGVWPDLTFVLDLPAERGLARARTRGRSDRLEQEPDDFHQRVRSGFLELARQDRERFRIINADADIGSVAKQVREEMERFLHLNREASGTH